MTVNEKADAASDRDRAGEMSSMIERTRSLQRGERRWTIQQMAELTDERDAARAEAAGLAKDLDRIKSGRWWRLRGGLLKVARAFGLKRAGPAPASRLAPSAVEEEVSTAPPRVGTDRPAAGLVVAYWPDVSGMPYQRLLYAGLDRIGAVAVGLRDFRDAIDYAPGVVHLHWTSGVMHRARVERDARRLLWEFVATLDELRARGPKLIWTIHNVVPHDCRFPELEAQLCQEIADRVDVIHIMCSATQEAIGDRYTLPTSRLNLIPLSSFLGAYRNDMSQEDARRSLGLEPDHTVLTCFGGIRPYKRIDELVDAFAEVHRAKPETRLVIAGSASPFPGLDALMEKCRSGAGVVAGFDRVPDDEVQRYLKAADVVVLPQRQTLNSAALMLAFTFGRPVVAPRMGCVEELVTPDVGLTFEVEKPGDLARALLEADSLKAERYRNAARERAEAARPEEIARRYASLISSLSGT